MVVMGVADQDSVERRKVGNIERKSFARVIASFRAEPWISEKGPATDLDEMAAVRDSGDGNL